jgi:lipopolysaccharide export system protein LptC
MKHWLYTFWDRLMLSLPLLLMALLALASYWLVRTEPVPSAPSKPKPPSTQPDYTMQRFIVHTFDAQGRLRTEITGDTARHYPITQQLEIDAIKIRSFDPQGRLTTATARRGLSNQDGSEIQLFGDARVVRAGDPTARPKALPDLEYRSEFLHAFVTEERVVSHKPVELLRGNDRISANQLAFDNVEQVLQMRGRVRATLYPDRP